MRLYKITASVDHPTSADGDARLKVTKYVGSQAEAAATRKELLDQGATRKGTETFEVDVPTDKAGLMAFLNEMVTA